MGSGSGVGGGPGCTAVVGTLANRAASATGTDGGKWPSVAVVGAAATGSCIGSGCSSAADEVPGGVGVRGGCWWRGGGGGGSGWRGGADDRRGWILRDKGRPRGVHCRPPNGDVGDADGDQEGVVAVAHARVIPRS